MSWGKCPGRNVLGEMSWGKCPGEMSWGKCPDTGIHRFCISLPVSSALLWCLASLDYSPISSSGTSLLSCGFRFLSAARKCLSHGRRLGAKFGGRKKLLFNAPFLNQKPLFHEKNSSL